MRILKIFLIIFSVFMILAIGILAYLIQPSGPWQRLKRGIINIPHKALQILARRRPITSKFFGVSDLTFDDGQEQIPHRWLLYVDHRSCRTVFTQIQSDQPLLHSYIDQYDLKRTRAIFVTHSHYDHALDIPMFGPPAPQGHDCRL